MRKRMRALIGSLAVAAVVSLAPAGASADTYWQCVPFARLISGIQIFGDAWTWWGSALKADYPTGFQPKSGAVLVFKPNGPMTRGHVAVVSQVLTDRVIQITHANWSVMGGRRGQVEKDVTVVDVSPRGDWSQVKVWYDPIRDLGKTSYPTYGFIYEKGDGAARNAMQTAALSAVTQIAAAVQSPTASPVQSIARNAAESTDRIAGLISSLATGGAEETQR